MREHRDGKGQAEGGGDTSHVRSIAVCLWRVFSLSEGVFFPGCGATMSEGGQVEGERAVQCSHLMP